MHGTKKTKERTRERAKYKSQSDKYNEQTQYWNGQGASPSSVYERLEAERQFLKRSQTQLDYKVKKLNRIVETVNVMAEKLNKMADNYDRTVNKFNSNFAEKSEGFVQGDYRANVINIYHFKGAVDLMVVIAHELGHALSLEHVADSRSIMHKAGNRGVEPYVSEADLAEYKRRCRYNRESATD